MAGGAALHGAPVLSKLRRLVYELDRVAFDLSLELGELERDSQRTGDVPGGRGDPCRAHDRSDCREDAPNLLHVDADLAGRAEVQHVRGRGARLPRRARRCA